jgi:RNA polymerase sigma factor (TIGR02999 family)
MPEFSEQLICASAWNDEPTGDRLFATLYHELHRLAHLELNRGGGRLSISATTLLHEFYLSIYDRDGMSFPDRGRFLAYAARAMRGLIIDATRRRRALKHGGAFSITRLDTNHDEDIPDESELMRIDEALNTLETLDPPLAELVDLRYFCGLSLAAIGAMRGVTERSIQRQWTKARLLLFNLLTHDDVP